MDRQNERERIWKFTLILLIGITGYLLFQQAKPFMAGVLGAFTLFILLRKPTYRLAGRMKPGLAVTLMTLAVTLFIIIPLSLLVWLLVSRLQTVNWNPHALIDPAREAIRIIQDRTGFDLFSEKSITFLAGKVTLLGQYIMTGIGDFFLNVLVTILLLFFFLNGGRRLESYIHSLLPFREENKREILDRIRLMVRSNAVGIPLLALIQGLLAWGGYALLNVPNAFLAAFLTGLASVIPVVGTALVWIPLSVYFFVMGMTGKGLILIAFGAIVIGQSDNLIRLILQKKMADTHPLITIFGVIAGLPLFGFMGIIFGPLLVSLFLLFLDLFRKEYLNE